MQVIPTMILDRVSGPAEVTNCSLPSDRVGYFTTTSVCHMIPRGSGAPVVASR